jgi:ribosomal protein L37AE/L43A
MTRLPPLYEIRQVKCPHCGKLNVTAATGLIHCKFCKEKFDPVSGQKTKAKPPKYRNEKVSNGAVTFDSKAEARRYAQLKANPDVKEIEVHPVYEIFPAVRKCLFCKENFKNQITKCPHCGRKLLTYQAVRYIADFKVVYQDGRVEIEDVKGVETAEFRLKRKLFEAAFPELTIKVVRMR